MVAAVGRIADNIFAGKDINRNDFKRQFGFLGGPQCPSAQIPAGMPIEHSMRQNFHPQRGKPHKQRKHESTPPESAIAALPMSLSLFKSLLHSRSDSLIAHPPFHPLTL